MMKNCRSQFAWPRAQLKESAIRRVVERQVVYNSWTTGPVAGSAAAVSAAVSSSGAGNGGATSKSQRHPLLSPGLPSEFRLRPLWWLRKISGFYSSRPPHCPVNASSLVFASSEAFRRGRKADGYIAMK